MHQSNKNISPLRKITLMCIQSTSPKVSCHYFPSAQPIREPGSVHHGRARGDGGKGEKRGGWGGATGDGEGVFRYTLRPSVSYQAISVTHCPSHP